MKFMIVVLMASLIQLFCGKVLAGPRVVGNGGDVIACSATSTSKSSVVLLDYAEVMSANGKHYNLDAKLTTEENVLKLINLMGLVSARLGKAVAYHWSTFFQEANFMEEFKLNDIKDENAMLLIPANCKLLQVAIQRIPVIPGDRYYNISKPLWIQMDSANQAGLIVHEILYRMYLNKLAPEIAAFSKIVRNINAAIAYESPAFNGMYSLTDSALSHIEDLDLKTIEEKNEFKTIRELMGTGLRFQKLDSLGQAIKTRLQYNFSEGVLYFKRICLFDKLPSLVVSGGVKAVLEQDNLHILEDVSVIAKDVSGNECSFEAGQSHLGIDFIDDRVLLLNGEMGEAMTSLSELPVQFSTYYKSELLSHPLVFEKSVQAVQEDAQAKMGSSMGFGMWKLPELLKLK